MKTFFRAFILSFLILASIQSVLAGELPDYRPALLGNHPRSLINLINAEGLMKRGQGNGMVMFNCGVNAGGYPFYGVAYRGTPNSELLRQELVHQIYQAQFEAAVFHHQHVGVYLAGTIVFAIQGGKPHVRIFLNQEEDDLKRGRDFIAPQFAFVVGNPKYKGIYYPGAPGQEGVAMLHLSVNEEGQVTGVSIGYEFPTGMKFGAAAASPIRDGLFIPGFRDGKRVACKFDWTLIFSGLGLQMKTG